MKKLAAISTILFTILAITVYTPYTMAQNNFGIGINAGGGTIGGNLPSIGSFNSSFFVESNPGFAGNVILRLSFNYAVNINVLLPQSPSRYTPFIKGISLKGIISQPLSGSIYVEEGLGIIMINDRTFGNINEWDTGLAFSILPGLDFRNAAEQGFKLGVGTEYGLTFTNTNVWFVSVHLQTEYYF